MTPRLSGHVCIFGLVFLVLQFLLGIARKWSREQFAILPVKPRSHVGFFRPNWAPPPPPPPLSEGLDPALAQFGLKIRGGGLPGTLLWIHRWKQEVKRAGGLSDETSTREDRGHQFLNLSLNRLRERLLVVYLPINVSVIPLNHCAT